MTLGERIKLARTRLKPKVTLAKIGEACGGVSPQAVSQWEKGEVIPDAIRLADLRKVLRVTYTWLLEGKGPPPPPDSFEVRTEDLSEAERQAVDAFIDALQRRRGHAA